MGTCGKNKKRARAVASRSMRLWTVIFKSARQSRLGSRTTLPGRLCAARWRTSSRRVSIAPSGNRGGRRSAPLSACDVPSSAAAASPVMSAASQMWAPWEQLLSATADGESARRGGAGLGKGQGGRRRSPLPYARVSGAGLASVASEAEAVP